jgi:hypothetical protein
MPNRREFLIGVGLTAAAAAAVLLPIGDSEDEARELARRAGLNPDEIVSYGPPIVTEISVQEGLEGPIWWSFDRNHIQIIERWSRRS